MRWFNSSKTATDQVTRRQSMDCVPLKNPQVQATADDDGALLLVYPVTVKPWFASLAKYLGGANTSQYRKKLQLDALGTATWQLVDGRSTVRQIVQRFAETYRLERKESEIAVTQFLRELGKRGLIAMR
jgi:hypothetical protein